MSGKYQKNSGKKSIALLLALMLLVGCVVGGTIAWLMTETTPVTNTFVAGKIGTLTLAETTGNEYVVIPGTTLPKNPTVTYTPDNVDAYVFVKVDMSGGWELQGGNSYTLDKLGENVVNWAVDAGWTAVPHVENVYYREVDKDAGGQSWSVIAGNVITISEDLTAEDLKDLNESLTFTAYAVQRDNFTDAEDAWEKTYGQ